MSRPKLTARSKKRGKAKSGFKLPDGVWRRTWIILGWTVSLGLLLWGTNQLHGYVYTLQPADGVRIEWMDPPAWFRLTDSQHILDDLNAAVKLNPNTDIYDPRVCPFVAQQLAASPWVACVDRVSKQPDGRVRVWATYREPFAFIQAGGIAYRVDRDGYRLPLPETFYVDFIQDRFWNEWFRITGVDTAPPAVGQQWPGEDVQAALNLVAFLRNAATRGEVPFRSSIRAIDVSNYDRREDGFAGEIQLRTLYPRYPIHWGVAPGEESGVEPPARRKLQMLAAYYAEQGRLPEKIIDVRYTDDTLRVVTPDAQ